MYIIIKSRFKKSLEKFIERAMESKPEVPKGVSGMADWVDARKFVGVKGEGFSLSEVKGMLPDVEVVGFCEDGSIRRRRF